MSESSLRELGMDLYEDRQFERALGVFAEAVRRSPEDHRSRMQAARCLAGLGEKERAVTALHACAEGLLRRDYLLSAIAACKIALEMSPQERRLRDTLARIHARAAKATHGRAVVPPPLPPETLYEGQVEEDLMTLSGEALSNRAIEVLSTPDSGGQADPEARPPLPLFADLPRESFVELVVSMGYRMLPPLETWVEEGQGTDAIYVLAAGKAEVRHKGKTRAYLSGGSIFGEMALLTGAPPTATVTALVETEVFELRREHLNALAKSAPSVPAVLAEFAQQRMARNLFSSAPLLLQIPESERAALLGRFSFRALQPGEKVLVEREHSAGLFLVLAGELLVQKDDPAGGSVTLSVLREGDVAGEISLITGIPATATVVATRKTAAAFLDRAAFDELIAAHPRMKSYLENLSDQRLRQIGEALRPSEIIDADELVMEATA
ncbi:MAG: cyclic nucleotide-binding domain-containing protein [Myxococcaceae bacterium]